MVSNVAIVTGGSSGIGAEFARQLAKMGYNLLLVSNQANELEIAKKELTEKYNIICLSLFCDLAQLDAANTVQRKCLDENLIVEVIINNAGIFTFKEIIKLSPEKLNLYIDLHIRVITQLSYIFAIEMKKRNRGYILNMSSMSCWMPMPGIGMYAATKAYIRVFSRSLYLEMKESGVTVEVACPGGIATNLFGLSPTLQRIGVKLGVLATPEKFVKGALKSLFKHRKQYINGIINHIAIFVVSLLPTRMRLIVKHKLLCSKNETSN
ncbi:MAG: SDR family NAD(P)-dependent oxidoreductase [Muribaculaceae bacterium]|nr:SDR family NAD(P)-dependent oxidoreductase [Muribaculaceae bacterium]